MMTLDYRTGSVQSGAFNFYSRLRRIGVPCRIESAPGLTFADFCFFGNGPDSSRLKIGVERKTTDEVLGAFTDSRFMKQMRGLITSYDVPVLIVEGKTWPNPHSGILMNGKYEAGRTRQRHLWENYAKFQFTLMFKARVFLWPTRSKTETVFALHALYSWYQKRWSAHRSCYTVDETKPDVALLQEQTLKQRIAAQLPGIYWTRSRKVDAHFDSIYDMITADRQAWKDALQFKEGKKIAARIHAMIRQSDEQRRAQKMTERLNGTRRFQGTLHR
jgi:ERCC4-type nuclease